MSEPLILIVDDDIAHLNLVQRVLSGKAHIKQFLSAEDLLADTGALPKAHLIILDWELPGINGLEALKQLRLTYRMPILFLTSFDTESKVVAALNAGADDYLVKPFRAAEMQARIQALLRRFQVAHINRVYSKHSKQQSYIQQMIHNNQNYQNNQTINTHFNSDNINNLNEFNNNLNNPINKHTDVIDVIADLVQPDSSEHVYEFVNPVIHLPNQIIANANSLTITLPHQTDIKLSNKEFALAVLLFHNVGRALHREEIAHTVWGRNEEVSSRTLDTHISRLRTRLNLRPESGWRLSPVYSVGYRLDVYQIDFDDNHNNQTNINSINQQDILNDMNELPDDYID